MQLPVTIVIPTHKRPRLLARALAHYLPAAAAGGLSLLVADSSPEPHAPVPEGVRYLHLPGLGFEAKLERVAPLIATPLAVLCADDDFTSVASIRRCAAFLAAHADHSGAHGHYLRVLRQAGQALVEPCYLDTHRAAIASDDPRQRLLELNRPYVPLFYAVLRTEVLQLAFGPGHGREAFYASSELALGLVAAMLGKVAVLPTLHTVRDIVPSVDLAGARCDDLGVVSTAPRYREVYGLFVDRLSGLLAGLLAGKDGLSAGAARQAVLDSVAGFVAGYCQRGGRKPLWRKLPKYGRRLARCAIPGVAARQDAAARAAREAALAAYLAPVGPEARAEQDEILAKLGHTPG